MASTQKKTQTRAYQIVAASVAAFFVANCIGTAVLLLSVRTPNVDLSSWYVWYLMVQLVPAVTFGLLWFVAKGSVWERLYQAAMLTVAVALLTSAATTCAMLVVWPLIFTALSDFMPATLLLNAFSPVLQMLLSVVFAVLLGRERKLKVALHSAVTVLIIALCIFFVVDISQTVYYVISQYPDNQNLSGFIPSFIGYGVAGLVFATTYFLEKRRRAGSALRSAAIVTTMGGMLLLAGTQLGSLIPFDRFEQWLASVLIALCILIAFAVYAWVYRVLRVLS